MADTIERFRADRNPAYAIPPKRRERRPRLKSRFIAGPFPYPQFRIAAQLPGKAVVVWLLIHHQCRVRNTDEVTLPTKLLLECGVTRRSSYRALAALEHVGLITTARDRGRGKLIRVSLVELPADEAE